MQTFWPVDFFPLPVNLSNKWILNTVWKRLLYLSTEGWGCGCRTWCRGPRQHNRQLLGNPIFLRQHFRRAAGGRWRLLTNWNNVIPFHQSLVKRQIFVYKIVYKNETLYTRRKHFKRPNSTRCFVLFDFQKWVLFVLSKGCYCFSIWGEKIGQSFIHKSTLKAVKFQAVR